MDHVRSLPHCIEAPYFQVYHAVYSTRLLQRFTAQTIHSHTAFLTFCSEYFTLTGECLGRKAFTSSYLVYALLCMLSEAGATLPDMKVGVFNYFEGELQLDRMLREHVPVLFRCFVDTWAKNHTKYCRLGPGICNCWIMDGHMKCKRSVCGNKKARVIDLGELGTVVLGCPHTPLLGSRYCFHCRRSAAHCKIICQPSVPDKPVQTSQVVSTSDAAAGVPPHTG